jgi:hypothetical protein
MLMVVFLVINKRGVLMSMFIIIIIELTIV